MREIVVPPKPPHTTSQGEAMQERERRHCVTGKSQLLFTVEQEKLTRKMDKKLTGSGEVGKPSAHRLEGRKTSCEGEAVGA